MYKIGYAASVNENSILNAMKFARDNGLKAVEINMNMMCFFPENYNEDDIIEIKKFKSENDIALTIHAPEDICLLQLHKSVLEAGVDRIKEIIEFGSKIDAYAITIHIGNTPCFTLTDKKLYLKEIYINEYKEVLKNTLIDIANFGKGKMYICIENSGPFERNLAQEVFKDISKENEIYLTWDIGHSYTNVYEEISFFEENLEKIRVCHIHDHNGQSDHQILGEGNIDFKLYFDKIKQDMIYIIEVRPRENSLKCVEYLKKMELFEK